MKYTSAEANKLIKRLEMQHRTLLNEEEETSSYVAATVETPEDVRPAYDYSRVQAECAKLEEQIRLVRHTLNVFNMTTKVEGFNMTIDQMLVYIPQMTARVARLSKLSKQRSKERIPTEYGNFIEYRYANYDVAAAKADYAAAFLELQNAQLALERVNTTETMEIDL